MQNICHCKMATSIDLLIDQALFWHHLVLKCRQNCIRQYNSLPVKQPWTTKFANHTLWCRRLKRYSSVQIPFCRSGSSLRIISGHRWLASLWCLLKHGFGLACTNTTWGVIAKTLWTENVRWSTWLVVCANCRTHFEIFSVVSFTFYHVVYSEISIFFVSSFHRK